jgi:hypothetical protein
MPVLVIAFVAPILGACGPRSAARPLPPEVPQIAAGRSSNASTADAGRDAVPTLHDLGLRAPDVAPGMRIVLQGEAAPPANVALARAEVDLCVRAIFAADQPLRVKLETAEDGVLAEVPPTEANILGLRGPVCVRKGRVISLTFDEGAAHVRYIVWGAP